MSTCPGASPPRGDLAQSCVMGLFARDKEQERYYLLPGMGGRAMQRKRKLMLFWGLAVGLSISLGLAAMIYFLHRQGSGL